MDATKVYAVRIAGNDFYTTIAMICELRNEDGFTGLCFLSPPDRPHMIEGTETKNTSQGFKYLSTGYAPGWWEFEELTIESFRDQHYKLVAGGDEIGRCVQSDKELHEWFNSRFPE